MMCVHVGKLDINRKANVCLLFRVCDLWSMFSALRIRFALVFYGGDCRIKILKFLPFSFGFLFSQRRTHDWKWFTEQILYVCCSWQVNWTFYRKRKEAFIHKYLEMIDIQYQSKVECESSPQRDLTQKIFVHLLCPKHEDPLIATIPLK